MIINNDNIKDLLNCLEEGAYIVNLQREIVFWNKSAEILTGFKANEIKGKYCNDNILKHIDDEGYELCLNSCPLVISMQENSKLEKLVYLHHKEGHRIAVNVKVIPILNNNNKVIGAFEIFSKKYRNNILNSNEELIKMAMYDMLTGLPNRAFLENEIDFKINEVNKIGKTYALFFVDIDDFKKINDKHGHNIGDIVLKMVSNSLRENIRVSDTIGRWGGEEFVGIISVSSEELLYKIIEKLRLIVENSEVKINEEIISVTISIGGTLIKKGDTKYKLIDKADKLMYLSKTQGKNKVKV